MEALRDEDPAGVGPYRLLRRLGGGGMGQVYLGRSRGGRLVAVKVVRAELAADPRFRRRFAREAEAARRVGGFHTAQVVDADPAADPPWLVTAYVPGPALHEAVLGQGPLPERSLSLLAAGLAEGLQAVHGCGMVHRDLKPGNVLLAADGPRLIDFGIARALDETSLTESGAVIGTPGFMAPEQVVHNRAEPATDVFALGAVLAYAATGAGPFGNGAPHAVMYRAVHEEPDLTGVSTALAPLIADCLAKDPRARPTVAAILDLLPAQDDTGLSWLPPDVRTMIDERDVTAGGGPRGAGAGADSSDDRGPTGGSGSDGPTLGHVVPSRAEAAARQAERERRESRAQERDRAAADRLRRRLLTGAAEVALRITDGEQAAHALAIAAAALQPLDPAHAHGVADEAARQARSASERPAEVRALAAVARELALADRHHARELATLAVTLAKDERGFSSKYEQGLSLRDAAVGLATVESYRAEELALGMPASSPLNQSSVVEDVAAAMTVSDPERAARLVGRAEGLPEVRADHVLGKAAEGLARTAPERAEAVARGITDRAARSRTVGRIARLAAGSNPDWAEQLARGIADTSVRQRTLFTIWSQLLGTDPLRAEPLARALADGAHGSHVLGRTLAKIAPVSPERAERLAHDMHDERLRAVALYWAFHALRGVDPAAAQRLARELPEHAHYWRALAHAATAEDLTGTDPEAARHLVSEATRLADELHDETERGHALGTAGAALARVDLREGERIVLAVTGAQARVDAMLAMAGEIADFAPEAAARLHVECARALHTVPPTVGMFRLQALVEAQLPLDPQGAGRTALGGIGIPYEHRSITLAQIATSLIEHDPGTAARIAVETVRMTRTDRDDGERNTFSVDALGVLAQVDVGHAVRLATDPEFIADPDWALLDLVRFMRDEAARVWDRHGNGPG